MINNIHIFLATKSISCKTLALRIFFWSLLFNSGLVYSSSKIQNSTLENESSKSNLKLDFDYILEQSIRLIQKAPDSALQQLRKAELIASSSNFAAKEIQISTLFHYFGLAFIALNNNDSALFYFKKSLVLFDKFQIGEDEELDSKLKAIKEKNLNSIGEIFVKKGDCEAATYYLNQAFKLFKETKNKAGIAQVFGNLGRVHFLQGEFDAAMQKYEIALKLAVELVDLSGVAQYVAGIGSIFYSQGEYAKALDAYFKALKINDELRNKLGISGNLRNIGNVYSDQGDYKKALDYYQKSLAISSDLKDFDGMAKSYNNIGLIHMNEKKYQEALNYYLKAYHINEQIGNKNGISINVGNIGLAYEGLNDINAAIEYYNKGLDISRALNNSIDYSFNLGNIGALLLRNKQFQKAEVFLKEAEKMNIALSSKIFLKDNYSSLSALYEQIKDFDRSLYYYKAFISISNELENEENQKAAVEKEMQYEFDKKEAVFQAQRSKEQALAKAEIEKRNLQRNASIGGFGLMLLLALVFFSQRNRIKKEKNISENLLLNILPFETAQELKAKGSADAKLIEHVTVLFTDFKGFTAMAEKLSPQELVADLNVCFSEFDRIMEKYGIEKIKTIGDSYMAAGGLPVPNDTHASDVVKAALEIAQFIEEGKQRKLAAGSPYFEIRIGIHTGPVVAGIVGIKKFSYDIWGDTVNTASRMESSGEIGKVNISETTYELVKNEFPCEYRGEVEAKGKGMVKMYFVGAKNPYN